MTADDLRPWTRRLAAALAVLAIAATIPVRFAISHGQPLWLDETWTAAIAAQPSWAAVVRQAWLDVNAPLYYLFMHLWAGLFGISDVSLRVPSAVFGAAAPLAVALIPGTGLRPVPRLTWAALLALWTQGLYLSGEARGYTLLILLCVLSTLAFMRLMRAPSLGRAAVWAGLAALAILAHYHALLLGALQGLAYLAVHRGKAVKTWPAALLFAPAFGWIAVHLPRIAEFMRPGIAWYNILNPRRVGAALAYPFGGRETAAHLAVLLALAVVAWLAAWWAQARRAPAEPGPGWPAWLAVAAGVAAAAIVIGMGFVRPSFTDRYLVPFTPAILLGVALVADRLGRGSGVVCAAAVAVFAWTAVPYAQRQVEHGWRWYNWEVASRDLMKARPQRLVFIWDHPASPILERSQLDMIGGFFFKRAGVPVTVRSLVLDARKDPNPVVLAALQDPRTALIWTYDRGVLGTAARVHPPRLSAMDPSLACRNYGVGNIGVLACGRQGSVDSAKP